MDSQVLQFSQCTTTVALPKQVKMADLLAVIRIFLQTNMILIQHPCLTEKE